MKTKSSLFSTIFLGALLAVVEAQAGTLDNIGFTDLKLELGSALPDGSSITVTQVEAPIIVAPATTGPCIPDVGSSEFGSMFYDNTQGVAVCTGAVSGHANSVAQLFYGQTLSSSTAIGSVDLFEVSDWLFTGFLNSNAGGSISASIGTSATRIANHSWGASSGGSGVILRRIDYLVEVDEFVQVVGVHTDITTNELPSNSFNAIVAGISAGTGITGTKAIDTTYVSGRAKPDMVAPETAGSFAAPRISSAAVLLMDYAHTSNAVLSNGSITNANGTIYNAELSETIKALLMAGADRATVGNTNAADITDYRVVAGNQTTNGLDTRFGAGQLNINNSYHLLAAGEQDSAEDGGTVIANVGFDYDPSFGGLNGSNPAATYSFSTSAIGGQKIKAALVWNLDVLTTSTDKLYNLDLQLFDVTGGTAVVISNSTIDNTENLWLDLLSNHSYELRVIKGTGQLDFDWDYALAWQIVIPGVTVVETASTTVTREDGTTDTFTLVLDSPPAGDVAVNLTSSDDTEATVSPASVTFTSSNWSTLQTVTVTGINDAIDDGNKNYSIDFTVSSVDANYNGLTLPGVSASNTDDDATFSFTDQTNVALNTLITSNTVVMSGLLGVTAISVTGGEYSINGGAYTSTNGNISNTDSVTLQTTSSVTGLTSVNVMLTIGDVGDTFSVTTEIDTDGDGVGDNVDAFINNLAASVDADNDGLPDEWNASCDTTCQVSSGLTLDVATSSANSGGGSLGLMWLLLPLFITAGRRRVL